MCFKLHGLLIFRLVPVRIFKFLFLNKKEYGIYFRACTWLIVFNKLYLF